MTNSSQNKNWERLEAVIRWSNMSINFFARYIGLPRGENLYQIRKGNNGISKDVARRVSEKFPEINEMWLLTGSGQMFTASESCGAQIPLYRVDAEHAITRYEKLSPDDTLFIPQLEGCDFAMYYLSDAMRPRIPAGSIIFLRQTPTAEIIPGRDYIIVSGKNATLRTVRTTPNEAEWRLEACDSEHFDAWTLPRGSVNEAWLVCGHLILNK